MHAFANPLSNASVALRAVRLMPAGEVIQVTPDDVTRKVADLPHAHIPRVGVADWQPAGDGTYRPIVRIHECFVRLTDAERVTGVPYTALRRLCDAAFVRWRQPTPGCVEIDLHSYFDHLDETRDPEFWTPARRLKYKEAL